MFNNTGAQIKAGHISTNHGDNKIGAVNGAGFLDQATYHYNSHHQNNTEINNHYSSGFNDLLIFCQTLIKNNASPLFSIMAFGAILYTGKHLQAWRSADADKTNLVHAVPDSVERTAELQQLNDCFSRQTTAIKQVAIVGITGAGKTELAKAYARYYRNSTYHRQKAYYVKKPLIYILSYHQLMADYEELAENLNITVDSLKETYEKDPHLYQKKLAKYINKALKHHPGWLLIFDDIDNMNSVHAYCPRGEGLNGSILYTTQNTSLLDHALRVDISDGLTKQDACTLLTQLTGLPSNDVAHHLIETLANLPLALMVAGLYIRHQREHKRPKGNNYASYLELHQNALDLLEDHQQNIYAQYRTVEAKEQTQMVALQLTISTLSADELSLLHFCSLLAEHPISEQVIIQDYVAQRYGNILALSNVDKQTQALIQGLRQRGLLFRKTLHSTDWFLHQLTRDYVRKNFCQILAKLDTTALTVIQTALMFFNNDVYKNEAQASLAWQKAGFSHARAFLKILAKIHFSEDLMKDIASCYGQWGAYGLRLGYTAQAKDLLEQALALFKKHYSKDHPNVAITLVNLANAYGDLGNVHQKKDLLERALIVFKKHYSNDCPNIASTLINLANAYGELGDNRHKKELLGQALAIQEAYYGKDHPNVAITLVNLAITHGELSDKRQKKELLERALAIQELHYGKEHLKVAKTLKYLASSDIELGNPQQAIELLKRVLAIEIPFYGKRHIEVAETLVFIDNAQIQLGKTNEAKNILQAALNLQLAHYGRYQPASIAKTYYYLAEIHQKLGDLTQARDMFKQVLFILSENAFSKEHPDMVNVKKYFMKHHPFMERAYPNANQHTFFKQSTMTIQHSNVVSPIQEMQECTFRLQKFLKYF